MARPAAADKSRSRKIQLTARMVWLLMLPAVLALTACSGGGGSGAGAAPSSHGRGAPAAAGSPAAEVTVPLKVVRHGRATLELVPVWVNGHGPFTFMLDTGSSISSVSRRLATRLRLRSSGTTTQIRGVVTSSRVPLVTVTDWKLGSAVLAPESVAVLDLSRTGGSVAGLLGSDELRHFGAITVDFARQRLRLAQP